tara:strand:+ start:975 stop:1562 length:588 start_codon:yes stop_codon:yes gene_type:complete
MGFEITDGGGKGYSAEVDSENRLRVFSISEQEVFNASSLGNSYNFNTGVINLTSASKSAVFYIKNNGDSDLIITQLFYLIGNSTAGTGDVLITVLRNPTTGTIISNAVAMEMDGVNRNFGSSKILTTDSYKGAEASTFTNGDKIIESIIDQSPTRITVEVGGLVIPRGTSIGIDITPATSNSSLDVEFAASVYIR